MDCNCEVCGEPLPEGETMFKFHGFSGPCPKPPMERVRIVRMGRDRRDNGIDTYLIDPSHPLSPEDDKSLEAHISKWRGSPVRTPGPRS